MDDMDELTLEDKLNMIYEERWKKLLEDDMPQKRIAEGIPLAVRKTDFDAQLVGIPFGEEGHTIIFGGTGSGKSTGPIMAALNTWKGGLVVTDPKGELYSRYKALYDAGYVEREPVLFDPTQEHTVKYDPYWILGKNDDYIIGNVVELAHAMIPEPVNCDEPYWVETKQAILEAVILFFYKLGLNFKETILHLMTNPLNDIIKELQGNGDVEVNMFLGSLAKLKSQELASHDRGLRNELSHFFANNRIMDAFDCYRDKDDNCFCWEDLRDKNIFIRIPEEHIDEWSFSIRLMVKQLFRFLESRPDRFMGEKTLPILLVLDEFARFGKIEGICNALCTLRSKNVNIILAIQSLAQLDMHYGTEGRRVICDNCRYKLVLQAGDLETQKYLSGLIGVHKKTLKGRGKTLNEYYEVKSYSRNKTESYLPKIFPHELASFDKAYLLSPYGVEKLDRISVFDKDFERLLASNIL